jgi:hypothetical protein
LYVNFSFLDDFYPIFGVNCILLAMLPLEVNLGSLRLFLDLDGVSCTKELL